MKSLLVLAPALLAIVSMQAQALPEGPGKSVFENICGSCHGLDVVTGQTGTRAVWQDTVDSMRGRGATGSDDDFKAIVDYLTKNFPPPAAPGQAPAAAPATSSAAAAPAPGGFPEGPGKSIFENTCGGCHGADIVIGQTGTRDVWQDTVDSMRSRGATGTDDDFKTIVDYLTKYFGVPVNVNQAPAKDLASNLVITADEAAAIVKYRTANGNFKGWDDLAKVQGLDIKKLDPIKSRITF
jgi:competence ComEA-like helix-hairpin-helix protein